MTKKESSCIHNGSGTGHCGGESPLNFTDESDSPLIVGKFYIGEGICAVHSLERLISKRNFYLARYLHIITVGIFRKPGLHEAIVELGYVDKISLRQDHCGFSFGE